MCIVVYKPKNIEMPNEETLKECFRCNRDGAGYMFPEDGKVQIKKGFMSFDALNTSLQADYQRLGSATPFVLHFRIGTHGGNNQANTHPFPLSKRMSDLKQLSCSVNCGVAHNGIISLTSTRTTEYVQEYDPELKCMVNRYVPADYSDTMKFITDYLALIIHNKNWYTNEDNINLIEKLIGTSNKLAIMNADGHTTLIGNFIEDGGVFYSNSTYKTYTRSYKDWDYDWEYDWEKYSAGHRASSLLANNPNYEYDKEEGVWRYKKKEEINEKTEENEEEDDDGAEAYYDAMVGKAMDELEDTYNPDTQQYEPEINKCPMYELEIYDYCMNCKHYKECWDFD